MNNYVVKGNFCYSRSMDELVCEENACAVIENGRVTGVFHTLPERYAALCGVAQDDPVTPALAAAVLRAEGYGSGLVYLNKVESAEDWRNAEAFAALLPAAVAAGSLWKGTYRTLRE